MSKSNWIKAKDRLPPLDEDVLLSVSYPAAKFVTLGYLTLDNDYFPTYAPDKRIWKDRLRNQLVYDDGFIPQSIPMEYVKCWQLMPVHHNKK